MKRASSRSTHVRIFMLLGVTFWYLLTGRTPFAGRSIEEVRAKQAEQLPLKQLKSAHVPLECVTLLKSMLALDPAKRPQTARELLTKIHRCYLRFEPAARRRRKRLVLASAGLALALVVAVLARLRLPTHRLRFRAGPSDCGSSVRKSQFERGRSLFRNRYPG